MRDPPTVMFVDSIEGICLFVCKIMYYANWVL